MLPSSCNLCTFTDPLIFTAYLGDSRAVHTSDCLRQRTRHLRSLTMATYMPQPQIPANPHQDFPLSTPPDQAMFHTTNNGHQSGGFAQMPNGMRITHRMSAEYRGNALANGSKAIPTGPQARVANAGSRNFGPQNGGPFDGPRSPPNTKSIYPPQGGIYKSSVDLCPSQIPLTCPVNSSRSDNVRLGKLAHSRTRRTHPSLTHHVNTLQRCVVF